MAAHEKFKRPTSAPSGAMVGPVQLLQWRLAAGPASATRKSSQETNTCSRATLRPCSESFSLILLILRYSLRLLVLSVVFFGLFFSYQIPFVGQFELMIKERVLGQWTTSPSSSFHPTPPVSSPRPSPPKPP